MVQIISFLPIITALFATLPSTLSASVPSAEAEIVPAHAQNLTERHFGLWNWNNGWSSHKCASVSGSWNGANFNFGCLCEADVDSFCSNNRINDNIKDLINSYIDWKGSFFSYPKNSQPTCNGFGGYSCGSLGKKWDGTCGSTGCDPTQCSTNGGCCPRGQVYINGNCCGAVGCAWGGYSCQPVLQCQSGMSKSNGVCCPSGQTGYENKYCCPAGQTGQNGQCVCPAGTKKNGDRCDSVCPSGHSWCSTKCCPPGSSEDPWSHQCVCNSDQQKIVTNNGIQSCVNKCDSGFTFYKSTCCPSGATENSQGKCQCNSNGQQLSSDGRSCVDKCSNGQSWSLNKCCPANSCQSNSWSDCQCNDRNQEMKMVNGVQKCVDKCKSGYGWCKSKCCPSWLDEDANGNCVCSDDAFSNNGWACVPKCTSSQKYDYGARKCVSICDESSGYVYQTGWKNNGMCCKKGQSACNTVCCPPGKEEIGNTGICCVKGSKVEGNKCIEPTGGNNNPKKRAMTGRFDSNGQIIVKPSSATYGLEANKDGKLCPASNAACPIPGRENEYECLETLSDLSSCGGCVALGQGQDCTQIPGARWMGCNVGKCEVYSCIKGWKRSADGTSCVKN